MEREHGANNYGRDVARSPILFDRRERAFYISKPRLAPEDVVATRFARVLEEAGVGYAVVAGYVAILFGRARRSDDIDFILNGVDEGVFVELCEAARRAGFGLMQGNIGSENSIRSLYRGYLARGHAVRFVYLDIIIPNVEAKLARTRAHRHAVVNSVRVVVNHEHIIRISPIELQIAYKLYLGSDKDLGDAIFLYTLLKEHISTEELHRWCRELSADCSLLEAGKA
ncbi:MAG: hypothetical protein F7C07_07590 [Desulfurococcales archaeon]|nr:hypothetical protein [Desulfurococcales archaeon]